MGRLVREVELRNTQSGTAVASFSLAVDRKFKDQNGNKQVDFLDCVAWKGTAETLSKYVSKGDMIAVVGSIQTRTWEDKENKKRKAVEILVDSFYFTGSKKNTDTGNNSNFTPSEPDSNNFEGDMDSDDLPF